MGRKKFKNKQELRKILEQLYFEEKCSMLKIARILNVYHGTIRWWFEKFGIPKRTRSETVSLAKSSMYHRPYDPSKDKDTVIELNALCHTDFTRTCKRRKICIQSSTTHIGQVYFFNKIAKAHNLMPVRCSPVKYFVKKGVLLYKWHIYTNLDETFETTIDDDRIRYIENFRNDRDWLLLYFTRGVECDGYIDIRSVSCSKQARHRKRIYAYVGFVQKDHQYVRKLAEIISERFSVPVTYRKVKGRDLTKLQLPVIDRHVADLFRKMPMLHPEKNLRKDLALKYTGEEVTEDLLREINSARMAIRQLRGLTVQLAKERRLLDRHKRVMAADELVEKVLKRYAERFNDYDVERYFRI